MEELQHCEASSTLPLSSCTAGAQPNTHESTHASCHAQDLRRSFGWGASALVGVELLLLVEVSDNAVVAGDVRRSCWAAVMLLSVWVSFAWMVVCGTVEMMCCFECVLDSF